MGQVQEGNEESYRVLLNEIGPILYAFVRRRVFNPSLVDDVYQEVLLTLHRARHSYQTHRPFAPWLFTVARHSLLDSLGRNRKFAEKEVPVEFLPEPVIFEKEQGLSDELRAALDALPDNYRKPVELLKLKGLTLEETAEALHLTVGTVKVRAHRGYVRLKKTLLQKREKK
jgi:RNA polymerase sigma factor (sigma-70 family)